VREGVSEIILGWQSANAVRYQCHHKNHAV
jgi:hypothetical protein